MAVSKEVQAAVDRIRKQDDIIRSLREADALRQKQNEDLKAQIASLQAGSELSAEDKKALMDAVNEQIDTQAALEGAVPANTDVTIGIAPNTDDPTKYNIPPAGAEGHPTAPLTEGDVLAANGPANHPAGGSQPPMPNMAFDPDPQGIARAADPDAGQPAQVPAVETAGGFVVTGGGTTQRAPGSSGDSPSSSVVVAPPVDEGASEVASGSPPDNLPQDPNVTMPPPNPPPLETQAAPGVEMAPTDTFENEQPAKSKEDQPNAPAQS